MAEAGNVWGPDQHWPKPMIPIVNAPLHGHREAPRAPPGFRDIAVTLQFLPDEIRDYFGDGSDWNVNIRYSIGGGRASRTLGSVKMAEQRLGLEGERLLIISGDALADADLSRLVEFHEEKGSRATIVLKSVEAPWISASVTARRTGASRVFLEKPAWGQVFSDTVNTGIYLLGPRRSPEIDPEEGEYDFSKELFPNYSTWTSALRLHHRGLLGGYRHPGAVCQRPADVLDGRVESVSLRARA